jgi:Tol biopolymer transport system component
MDGHWQLFTIDPDGTGQRQITDLRGDAIAPEWSPDGKRIVFEYDRPKDAGCVVMLIDADGANPFEIPGGRGCDNQPSFTPDGRRLVFVRYDAKADRERIVSTDLEGRDVRVIVGTNDDTDPNVSPDGRTLTFLRIKEDEKLQALFAVDIDGRHLRRLTPFADNVGRKHAWSPDGTRILITVNADWAKRGESANIVSMRPDGSDRRRLTRFTGGPLKGRNAFVGSYSSDGRHIVMRVQRNGHGGLAIMDADGSRLRMITKSWPNFPKGIDWGVAP